MVDFSHMGGVAGPTYDKEGKLVKLVLSGLSSIDGLNIRDLSDLKSLEIRDCNFLNFPAPLLSHCDALEELVMITFLLETILFLLVLLQNFLLI